MMRVATAIVLACLSCAIAAAADLQIEKFALLDLTAPHGSPIPTVLRPGERVLYFIRVANNGPDTATNIQVIDPLPTRVVFDEALSSASSCTTPAFGETGIITCPIASLAPGATRGFSVIVRLRADDPSFEPVVNTATVSSATPDPNLANNTAIASTPVAPTVPLSREALITLAIASAAIAAWKLAR